MFNLNWDNFSSWSVLVIEDEPDNAAVIVGTLEFYGARVILAEQGAVALDKLREHTPTLVLCDLSMPVMDGWDFFATVRADPAFAGIPIVALSAHAMAGDKQRALDMGFDGYITKPINVRDFLHDLKMAFKAGQRDKMARASDAADTTAAPPPADTPDSPDAPQPVRVTPSAETADDSATHEDGTP